jgi:hypothetical protein
MARITLPWRFSKNSATSRLLANARAFLIVTMGPAEARIDQFRQGHISDIDSIIARSGAVRPRTV